MLDDRFAEVYEALSALSDGVLGTLTSDESERIWVVTFIHDRDPATTWLYDHTTGESRILFRPYPTSTQPTSHRRSPSPSLFATVFR